MMILSLQQKNPVNKINAQFITETIETKYLLFVENTKKRTFQLLLQVMLLSLLEVWISATFKQMQNVPENRPNHTCLQS